MSGKPDKRSNYDHAVGHIEADSYGEPQMPWAWIQLGEAGIAAVLAVADEIRELRKTLESQAAKNRRSK